MTAYKAIITGAANGIGKAIARKLHSEGVAVFACDIDRPGLDLLKEEIPAIQTFPLDITDHAAVAAFFEEVNRFQCNWLVNNAGIYPGRSVLDYTPAELQQVIAVNCIGMVYFTQFFARNLLAAKLPGAIVNLSSVSAQEGSSDAVYGMTKAAVLGLTKSNALNFAPLIRVNAVAPALVETAMIRNVPAERMHALREKELLQQPILPESIAGSVFFLLSEQAGNITGITLDINNGQYMR